MVYLPLCIVAAYQEGPVSHSRDSLKALHLGKFHPSPWSDFSFVLCDICGQLPYVIVGKMGVIIISDAELLYL